MCCKFKIKGLDCANCAAELERKIQKIEGVTKVSISFMAEKMEVECDADSLEKIKKTIKKEEPDVSIDKI